MQSPKINLKKVPNDFKNAEYPGIVTAPVPAGSQRSHSPELLDDFDVLQVDAGGGGRVDDSHDGVHAHGRQQAGVLRHHLGAQRRGGAVEQRLAVAQLHRPAHGRQHLHAFLHGLLERLGDDGGVDT